MTVEALILFAGAADGWGIGLKRAGITPIALAESVPERRAALRHHHPEAVIYEDVRHVTRERLLADLGRLPSVVVGSPPCQDISTANNGRAQGVDGERSRLYFDFIRIVGEVGPDWYAAENSAAVRTRGYDRLHAALDAVDYTCWPSVVGAREVGYFHLRKRSWLAGVHVSDAQGQSLGSTRQSWKTAPRDASDPDRVRRPEVAQSQRGDVCQRKAAIARARGSAPADADQISDGGILWKPEPETHDDRSLNPASDAGSGDRRSRHEGERGQRSAQGAEPALPAGLEGVERAARALGLGGRTRLAEHYRMADGVRSGLARLCISAYGDAVVPDIAEAFARVMPRLVAELRSDQF